MSIPNGQFPLHVKLQECVWFGLTGQTTIGKISTKKLKYSEIKTVF